MREETSYSWNLGRFYAVEGMGFFDDKMDESYAPFSVVSGFGAKVGGDGSRQRNHTAGPS